MGVICMFIRHAVKDFTKWKAIYDADQGARQAAGLRESDLAQAKAFAASIALRDRMAVSGVIGRPEIVFLSDR